MQVEKAIGQQFGRLTVLRKSGDTSGRCRLVCLCACGVEKRIQAYSVLSGKTKSCGCLQRETFSAITATHRLSNHPLYHIWCHIRGRCLSPKVKEYPYYGGRGIKICGRWDLFENFLADVGERPFIGASLDRINNDGDYEPSNVRWATSKEQGRNKRNNRQISFNGKTQNLSAWAEELGLNQTTIRQRLMAYKWSVEKALTTPLRKF